MVENFIVAVIILCAAAYVARIFYQSFAHGQCASCKYCAMKDVSCGVGADSGCRTCAQTSKNRKNEPSVSHADENDSAPRSCCCGRPDQATGHCGKCSCRNRCSEN